MLGAAYYGISPLFRNVELHEADPSLTQVTEIIQGKELQKQDLMEQTQDIPKTETSAPALQIMQSAPVVGTVGHPASGTARIVENEGKKYLRYENFKTINGPDLFVYLSKDIRASDFINLGQLKATEGNINYEIPIGTDIKDYPYALIWCRAFSVLFNSADLSSVL